MDQGFGIDRRRAWQFAVVPIRRVGNELEVLSTIQHAARAMRFIRNALGLEPRVRLVDEARLLQALRDRFAFGGGEPRSMRPGHFDVSHFQLGDNGD
ncbi:MAG: hypothetical protein ACO32J_06835 [Phycisphaerales bacterium]|jgi:hypothetical protein